MILRKPGKPDYTVAKAYRPIALENTLDKVIKKVVVDCLLATIEEYALLL